MFFILLTETSKEGMCLIKLEEAYEKFAVDLNKKLHSEMNISEQYYNLGLIRLELVGIQHSLSDEKKKKCIYCC